MEPVDIFIDLESIGIGKPQGSDSKHIDSLLRKTRLTLREDGLETRHVWATASTRCPGTPPIRQAIVREIIKKHEGIMLWTTGLADDALKRELRQRLEKNELAPYVLLITSDSDFCPDVKMLVKAGIRVIVSGTQRNKRYEGIATKVLHITELIKNHEYVMPLRPEPTSPFNGIPLP